MGCVLDESGTDEEDCCREVVSGRKTAIAFLKVSG